MYGASWTVVDPARDPKQSDIGCLLTEAGEKGPERCDKEKWGWGGGGQRNSMVDSGSRPRREWCYRVQRGRRKGSLRMEW